MAWIRSMKWVGLIGLICAPLLAQNTGMFGTSSTRPTTRATPEEMLNQMLGTGPARPIRPVETRPTDDPFASTKGGPPPATMPAVTVKLQSPGKGKLLREGTDITDRSGTLARADNGQWAFIYDNDAQATHLLPMGVLPNIELSLMENVIAASKRQLHFRISGTVTEYRDRNYLLISEVADRSAILRPEGGPALVDRTSGAGAVAPRSPQLQLLREGTDVPDRLARFQRAGNGYAQVTFESDGKGMQDPPMLLLPSLKLAMMENAVGAAESDPRFRVSGVVSEYQGRNYLLLSKAVAIIDKDLPF